MNVRIETISGVSILIYTTLVECQRQTKVYSNNYFMVIFIENEISFIINKKTNNVILIHLSHINEKSFIGNALVLQSRNTEIGPVSACGCWYKVLQANKESEWFQNETLYQTDQIIKIKSDDPAQTFLLKQGGKWYKKGVSTKDWLETPITNKPWN